MLRDVIRRGTGIRARRALGRSDIAGKTGTTNDAADTWFNGYHPDVATTVWVGFPNHQPLGAVEYGSNRPLPIWIDYMREALKGVPESFPDQPPGVVTRKIDPTTGTLANAGNPDAIFEAETTGTKIGRYKILQMIGGLFTGRVSMKNIGGPIMIAAVAGSEASQGIPRLLIFLTFLSANLAILNFLPIPALDGGHMVFLTAEAVTGKPVDERLQGTLTLIGVVALLSLMIFVFGNDIHKLFF